MKTNQNTIEINLNQDVPEPQQAGLTSSIGSLWPPQIASFNRIKGIYTQKIIDNKPDLESVINELFQQVNNNFSNKITRISLRAVVSNEILRSLQEDRYLIEALIPLKGTQNNLENTILVYFGLNHSTRQSLKEELGLYKKNMQQALLLKKRSPREILERVEKEGYSISIINKNYINETIIDQITELYIRFNWNRNNVREILLNPNNLMAIAYKKNQIVSAGIAELAKIPLDKNYLRITEITEAATADGHTGNGLYTAVSSTLLLELTKRSKQKDILDGEIDFVFGECNGNAIGVLRTAKLQGRTFSIEIGKEYGFPESGILYQHVPISGVPRNTPYNDLFPAFITRENLYKFWSLDYA